jgi:hypothetical protein
MNLTPIAVFGLLGFLGAFFPAQTKQSSGASRMALTTYEDACTGLDDAQCCAQSLEIAGWKATGDQLPKAAKRSVLMSCGGSEKVVPDGACRNIALMRGFGAKDVSALCAAETLQKRCKDSESCDACVRDLDRLKFKNGARACYAVTHVPERADAAKVIVVQPSQVQPGQPNADGAIVVRKRRTVVQ